MGLKITGNNNIYLTRGDTLSIVLSIVNGNNQKISLVSGDKIHFTVKTSTNTVDKILQKIITSFVDGNAIIELSPNDTKDLEYLEYVYDIQLTQSDGNVTTIIEPSLFVIGREVTFE